MNNKSTAAIPNESTVQAVRSAGGDARGGRCRLGGVAALVCAGGLALSAGHVWAAEPGARDGTATVELKAGTTGGTNVPVTTLVPVRRASSAITLADTPSAAVVLPTSPLMDPPATAALSQLSARSTGAGLNSRMNRETLQEAIDRGARQFTPEQAGSAFGYLRRKPTWRGVWDLLDPTAPVEKAENPAAITYESRRDAGVLPRSFRDSTVHEAQLRVF